MLSPKASNLKNELIQTENTSSLQSLNKEHLERIVGGVKANPTKVEQRELAASTQLHSRVTAKSWKYWVFDTHFM